MILIYKIIHSFLEAVQWSYLLQAADTFGKLPETEGRIDEA